MNQKRIPDDVFLFAGYALAHAAYSISDVEEGELLIPFVLTEVDGKQTVRRFESESQADAIASGKQYISRVKKSSDLWALAREGTMKTSEETDVDVLVISAGQLDLTESLEVVQPFRPNRGRDEFAIFPHGIVAVGGEFEDDEQSGRLFAIVKQGISYHPRAELWDIWQARGAGIA
ncbi:MAG: hypothetical protein GWP69_04975 [Gammaproteobacteria bacterium]|jgi:hypothetical protein|nr:hypothetical protein [Gammaproteobacteria bacterium]